MNKAAQSGQQDATKAKHACKDRSVPNFLPAFNASTFNAFTNSQSASA